MKKILKIIFIVLIILTIPIIAFWIWSGFAVNNLIDVYESRESGVITDRNGEIIHISQNANEFYALYIDEIPRDFAEVVIAKEDKYFYYHPGVNPVSTGKAVWDKVVYKENRAQSTLTQQLAKILLGNEQERNIGNKAQELMYAFALEARLTKDEILEMYLNSIYFGNQVQGVEMASELYFNRSPGQLDKTQMMQLLASISSPSTTNPFMSKNKEEADMIAERLGLADLEIYNLTRQEIDLKMQTFQKYISQDSYFEYKDLPDACEECTTSIDNELSNKIREVINEQLIPLSKRDVHHAAVIVIKYPENEILAIIGSPDPNSNLLGDKINMANQPRPIGSTIKPFLYAKGFSQNLRPYTLVDDREYKYTTALGFAHYPKNYDYTYQGIVTLHKSLSNSLNVPSVKVLEYIGLQEFYSFLLDDLLIEPVQPLDNYQYGIALGHLEMTLLDLCYRFTIFAQEGNLYPLNSIIPHNFEEPISILADKYIQLTNKILSDRATGSDQFGLTGNLHVSSKNVAVKTGTSREYHDSWTVGYTPDFLVGVWVGNANNTSMDEVTGQEGAGAIWHDVMGLMLNSEYNYDTEFNFDDVDSFGNSELIEYGLIDDDYEKFKALLLEDVLIVFPHDLDEILYEEGMEIEMEASSDVEWYIDGEFLDEGDKVEFAPEKSGTYEVQAKNAEGEEEYIEILLSE